jgi:hypothetical protein
MALPHHSRPTMSPPARPPAQQQQQQQSNLPQQILNELHVDSISDAAVHAAMRLQEEANDSRSNAQFPTNKAYVVADSHSQVGSLANSRAAAYKKIQAQAQAQARQQTHAHNSPQHIIIAGHRYQPQQAQTQWQTNFQCSPQYLMNTNSMSQRNLNTYLQVFDHFQNNQPPMQAHPQAHLKATQKSQYPQDEIGPLLLNPAQTQMQAQMHSLLYSQDPTDRALAQMMLDRDRGVGSPLSPASHPMVKDRYLGHSGQRNDVGAGSSKGDNDYVYVPTLQGFQHQDVCRGTSPNRNGGVNSNEGQHRHRQSFSPKNNLQSPHHATNNNQAYRGTFSSVSPSRQPTQASPLDPPISCFRQSTHASPPRPLSRGINVNEGDGPTTRSYGHIQHSLPSSSRATASTLTQRPVSTPVSHCSPPAPAQNCGSGLKRMLSTGASQYVEGPPTKRPNPVPPGSTGPSIGQFAAPKISQPANVAARNCSLLAASSRQSMHFINDTSQLSQEIDRCTKGDGTPSRQRNLDVSPNCKARMEDHNVPQTPSAKTLLTTREHISNDRALRCKRSSDNACDLFSDFSEKAKSFNSDEVYSHLGLTSPIEAKSGPETGPLREMVRLCHQARPILELDMLAKSFGVNLSTLDTRLGGAHHLTVGERISQVPEKTLKDVDHPLSKNPKGIPDTEKEKGKEKGDIPKVSIDLNSHAVTPLVSHPTSIDRIINLLKPTARHPVYGDDLARCTVEEDGSLRAPDPGSPTEQHAVLMWLLKSHEEQDLHDNEDQKGGFNWLMDGIGWTRRDLWQNEKSVNVEEAVE